MRVVDGDLSQLDHGVAVTRGFSSDAGVHVGDRLLGARVVAVVRDAPDLYSDVIAPASLVPAEYRDTAPEAWFVDPGDTDLAALLKGTDASVLSGDDWIDQVDQETRSNNNLGLWILLGPAGFYAAIAIVNSVLVGASQRRGQLRSLALLGATREQLRRMALWEAGLVGAAALLVGGAVTARRRLDDPLRHLGRRRGPGLHPALAAPGGDRRHLCGVDPRGRSRGEPPGGRTGLTVGGIPGEPGSHNFWCVATRERFRQCCSIRLSACRRLHRPQVLTYALLRGARGVQITPDHVHGAEAGVSVDQLLAAPFPLDHVAGLLVRSEEL